MTSSCFGAEAGDDGAGLVSGLLEREGWGRSGASFPGPFCLDAAGVGDCGLDRGSGSGASSFVEDWSLEMDLAGGTGRSVGMGGASPAESSCLDGPETEGLEVGLSGRAGRSSPAESSCLDSPETKGFEVGLSGRVGRSSPAESSCLDSPETKGFVGLSGRAGRSVGMGGVSLPLCFDVAATRG